jgi:hypothetical protein
MYNIKQNDSVIEMNGILWKIKQIMQHVLKMQYIFLLPKYIKLISRGVFLHLFAYGNSGNCVKPNSAEVRTCTLAPFCTCMPSAVLTPSGVVARGIFPAFYS